MGNVAGGGGCGCGAVGATVNKGGVVVVRTVVVGVGHVGTVDGSLGTLELSLVLGINTGTVLIVIQETEEDVQSSGQDGTTKGTVVDDDKNKQTK